MVLEHQSRSTLPERWQLTDTPPADRDEAWREIISSTHLPWTLDVVRDERPACSAEVVRHHLGDIDVMQARCGPCGGRRLRSDIRRTSGEYVGVLVVRTGREVVEQGEQQVVLGPGDVVTWQSDRPLRFDVLEPLDKFTMLVPAPRFREVVRRPELTAVRPIAPGPARDLFTSYLDLVSTVAPGPSAAPAAGAAALDLLGAALLPVEGPTGRAGGHTVLREGAKRYIETHLAADDLTPHRIAARLGVSERLLYSVFEQEGDSVSAYVRRRRLARAYAELERAGCDVTIREVARRWGFDDPAHFTRAFGAAYGFPPSQLRGRNVPDA